ncbi:unnamed protein product, partial [Allacma fusca]
WISKVIFFCGWSSDFWTWRVDRQNPSLQSNDRSKVRVIQSNSESLSSTASYLQPAQSRCLSC